MLPLKICFPTRAATPPAGPDWLHEIKHDGYRMLAGRDGERTRLISRRGLDWGDRFRGIVTGSRSGHARLMATRSRALATASRTSNCFDTADATPP
jgi:ATP-dependent DNA ligase